jgi:hypothetical protein
VSEQPERPPQPGVETQVPKDVVAGAQAALDATFNGTPPGGGDPAEVERRLRQELGQRGVAGGVPEAWIVRAATSIAGGEPVAAEPGDA